MPTKLENITTKIQNVITKVNTLPEAGDDSGSSELLFFIGELPSSSNQTFGVGDTIFSVTGLGFKPKHVMIYIKWASSSVTFSDSSTMKKLLTFCQY